MDRFEGKGRGNGGLSAEEHGEQQQLFDPRRTRRGAENFNTFFPRRATEEHGEHLFCPRRDAEGSGELQHLFVHRGPRRNTENGNCFLVRGGRGGARRTSTPFLSAEGAENTLDLFELRGAVVFTLNGFGDQRCSLTRRLRSSLPWLPKLKIRPTWSPAALR